jgi:hypothetical protein
MYTALGHSDLIIPIWLLVREDRHAVHVQEARGEGQGVLRQGGGGAEAFEGVA